jgi:tetratricopeptide (TPR) repeat protein
VSSKAERRKQAFAAQQRRQARLLREEELAKGYRNLLILLAILVLTALIYSNMLHNEFIYFDDPEMVVDNLSIRRLSWDNLVHYFTTPFHFTYLPIGLIAYAIDYQIGGLDPFIYHLDSLLVHLATVVLVYWLFQAMTGKATISLFTAAVFAIHPINVDNVDWIATHNNLLAALFFLAALLFYTQYIKRDNKARYLVWAFVFFVLSAFSKYSSVVLPVVLFLWDYYYDRKLSWKLFLEKIPFFLVSLGLGIMTLQIRTDIVPPENYNLLDRFIIFTSALSDYFYRLLFPLHLSMAYKYPVKDGLFLSAYLYLTPLVAALVVWVLDRLRVPRKALVLGLGFFLLNIVLSQAVLLIDNYKASRYACLSYIGLFFILAHFNDGFLSAAKSWMSRLKYAWMGLLVVFAAGFSYLTYQRNFVWKDTISLFNDVIAKEPEIPWVYTSRGIAKYRGGDLEGAMADFNYTLQLDSAFPLALYYRGIVNTMWGYYDEALADLDLTIAYVPDFGNAYNDRGRVLMELGDYQAAIYDLDAALSIDPYFTEAYLNRGFARDKLGDFQGAVDDYSWAVYYDPEYTVAYYYRGVSRSNLGDYSGALDDFSTAIDLDPGYSDAFFMRGLARLNLNDPAGACSDIRTALSFGYQPEALPEIPGCAW